MTRLLFALRGVPDDEAEDVRELLDENQIDFYETTAGNWGISMPGLWINNDEDWLEAKRILDIYQKNRTITQQALYQQLKEQGRHKRMFDVVKQSPTRFLFYMVFIVFIIYISIKLVFEIGL